ncbi:hypothetical protein [Micromonospora sp. NPDC005806]|uniref:hypothetical protein n=1 Tax=Micromonospora sp. NPDC005806 TaxID=3364234 RepID=UPI0036B6CB35
MELLAGLLGAVVGFVSKAITDALTERRRREGERRARLLEAKLRHVLDLMEAAARLTRARQSASHAYIVLDNVKGSGDNKSYQHHLALLNEAKESAASAFTDAEKAYSAICLLVPPAAGAARRYLDLFNEAEAYPDKERDARERARHSAEEAMRTALASIIHR